MDSSQCKATSGYSQQVGGKRLAPWDSSAPGSPPKLNRVCAQTARLTLAGDPPGSPVSHTGMRTVEPCVPENTRAPRFDFQFIDSERELHSLLASCAAQQPQADIILMTQPDGLARDNLVSRLSIQENGQHLLREGRLFDNDGRALHLVLDLRPMTGEEIAAFNDLLDPVQPMLYHKPSRTKVPVGAQVSITVLASRDQIPKNNNSSAPGGDFWRRINRPGNSWQTPPDSTAMEVSSPQPQAVMPWPGPSDSLPPLVPVNLHLSQDWRRLLYGGPGVNMAGRICHLPGALEKILPGQSLLLRGPVADNPELQQHLGQLMRLGHYQANGIQRQLPPDVRFYHEPVDKQELTYLSTTVVRIADVSSLAVLPANLVVVNQTNLPQWLNPVAVNDEGCSVPNTSLMTQLAQGVLLLVTSSLTEAEWFLLLGQLHNLFEKTDITPDILLAPGIEQPAALASRSGATTDSQTWSRWSPAVRASLYADETQLPCAWQQQSPPPLTLQINANTSANQLFDNLFVQSERPPRFGRHTTDLQQALEQGTPVVIQGLHTNPGLQQLLESLCLAPPSVTINGRLRTWPRANIHVLWPEELRCTTPLWAAALKSAASISPLDCWNISALRHGISVDDMPRQAIQALYKAYDAVLEAQTTRCSPLPTLNAPLLDSLITAARQAQQADRATDCQPHHWRKAINGVLTHATRANQSVRDYMKVMCEQLLPDPQPQHWVDVERLTQLLAPLKKLDAHFIQNHFWSLARAFSPCLFNSLSLRFDIIDEQRTDLMTALVVTQAPPAQRAALELALKPDPVLVGRYASLPVRSSSRIKRLQDALASGWMPRPGQQNMSRMIETIAWQCQSVADDQHSQEAQKLAAIKQGLASLLHWSGQLPAPMDQLALDMLHSRQNQSDRQQRRLARLKARLEQSPVLFVEGETATGKSYFSSLLAAQSGHAWIASIGPATSERELVHTWVWKDSGSAGGRSMERLEQTLMAWIKTQPGPTDDYLTLVLDEANLAQKGLLDCLKGLWNQPPCVYVDGQPMTVSPRHRVILTGNPLCYDGRDMDNTLMDRLQHLHYPPLDQAFLQDRVVEPALCRHLAPVVHEAELQTAVTHTAGAVMALWKHLPPLLPDYGFTPRDLADSCAWIGWYLQQHAAGSTLTQAYLNTLVWQAWQDVVGLSLPDENQDGEYALRCWFAHRHPLDESALALLKTQTLAMTMSFFRAITGRNHPGFDTSIAAVSELADCLAQDLMRCQAAFQQGVRHGGRQATLIEGPTGRGKDATLNHLLASYSAQLRERGERMPRVVPLNACDCSWETLASHIRSAQVHGQILVISEMNLIPSAYLEGELNAILAGNAHPGFHLFATVNPPGYTGRKPLSPALKGRFRYVPLRSYNADELEQIARRVLPANSQGASSARQLSRIHCHLRQLLLEQGVSLQPTALDLQALARAAASTCPLTQPVLTRLLEQYYQIYLIAADTCPQRLLAEQLASPALHSDRCDQELTHWLNTTMDELDAPWQVKRGRHANINAQQHRIILSEELTEQEARSETLNRLAQAQWQESGLPLDPPESDGPLMRAFYKRWQQLWYQCRFGGSIAAAEKLFELDEIETATLLLPVNQPYVQELTRLVLAMGDVGPLDRPVCWKRIQDMTNLPTSHYASNSHSVSCPPQPQTEAARSTATPAPAATPAPTATPMPTEAEAIRRELDTNTKYSANPDENLPVVRRTGFIPEATTDLRMCRQDVYDICVSEQGRLVTTSMGNGEYGVEVVEPAPLEIADSLSLDWQRQCYGVSNLTVRDHKPWLPLCSVKPHDQLQAVRIEPNTTDAANAQCKRAALRFHVIRDCYTGLYRVNIPDAREGNSFRIHYLLQLPQPRHDASPVHRPAHNNRPDAQCSEKMKDTLDLLFSQQTLESLPSPQRTELEAILQTDEQRSRVDLIAKYCTKFSGESRMKEGENQLFFLLTERQGRCEHRAPAFVALCRYFGIPARVVCSDTHAYGEYSLNDDRTWQACDLGGSPANVLVDMPALPSFTPGCSMPHSTSFRKQMKGYNDAQRKIMAQALGLDVRDMEKMAKTGSAVPFQPSMEAWKLSMPVADCLWREETLEAFLMGVELLKNKKPLEDRDRWLVQGPLHGGSQLPRTLAAVIASNQYTQAFQDALMQLHAQFVEGNHVSDECWGYVIFYTLNILLSIDGADRRLIIPLAREALQRKWLVFKPRLYEYRGEIFLDVLEKLVEIPETKALAEQTLQLWYKNFLGQPYGESIHLRSHWLWRGEIKDLVFFSGPALSHSPTLMKNLVSKKTGSSWTDEPQGAPDIERLLTGEPAFKRLGSCLSKNRPLIVTGLPDWKIWEEKFDDLLESYLQANPSCRVYFPPETQEQDLYRVRRKLIHSTHARVIKYGFLHFLYQLKKTIGCHFVYCWTISDEGPHMPDCDFGHCVPNNFKQLLRAVSNYRKIKRETHSDKLIAKIDVDRLRKALNIPRAHVLRLEKLDEVYREFVYNIDKNALAHKVSEILESEKDMHKE